ncbi:MAG TPA: 4Fe-4S binding protein, partial [Anaerolineaceae bacterium]|nr:4Fe-4S binding protein [Anaerolineaceae bacterium]
PGEWLQQGSLVAGGARGFGLNRRWPKKLNGAWLQVAFFALMGLFSAAILTTPAITAGFLLGLIVLALVLSLVFERRAFCRHICPIGGFSGLYAQLAPLEVRVADRSVCAACRDKPCFNGSAAGYGCPWGNFPAALKSNFNCGLCTECLRTCPQGNMVLRTRPYGAELAAPGQPARLDEAAFNLLMLGSAVAFTAVFLGPWGWLKSAAYSVGTPAWLLYAAGFLSLVLGVVPGLFTLAVRLSLPAGQSLKKAVAERSRALLPLGAATWMAFTVSFALAKAGYLLPVLSDPFGWGWDLFGTARLAWSPDVAGISPPLQAVLLVGGLLWTGRLARQSGARSAAPLLVFSLLYTLLMLWLLVG